jgi:ADP-ribosylglycohydrolase
MKKALLSVATLLGGVAGILGLLRLLPPQWREKLSELPGSTMGWIVENMPDE